MDQHTPTDSDALLSLLQQVKQHYQERRPPRPGAASGATSPASRSCCWPCGRHDAHLPRRGVAQAAHAGRGPARRARLHARAAPHHHWPPHGRAGAGGRGPGGRLGERIAEEVAPPPGVSQVSAIDGRMYEAAGRSGTRPTARRGTSPPTCATWTPSRGRRAATRLGARLSADTARAGLAVPVPLWAAWRANHANEAAVATTPRREPAPGDRRSLRRYDLRHGAFTALCAAGGWVLTPRQLPSGAARGSATSTRTARRR